MEENVGETAEAYDPPAGVVELCKETFQKTAEYLRGELDGESIYSYYHLTIVDIVN